MGEAKRRRDAILRSASSVGGHYLLIIQWLSTGETPTGALLADRVSTHDGIEVALEVCDTADDVRNAISRAHERLLTRAQFPFIHFEAHGEQPVDGNSRGLIGPTGELLTWESLTDQLSPLNVATGFRLVVIGAACYSIGSLDMFHVKKAAPYTLVIGATSAVDEGRLLAAMREFYRQMFRFEHRSIATALQSANRELHASKGEALLDVTVFYFAEMLMTDYLTQEMEPSNLEAETKRMFVKAREAGANVGTLDEFRPKYKEQVLSYCEDVVDTWFAVDRIPDNRVRFRIPVREWARLIEERSEVGNQFYEQ